MVRGEFPSESLNHCFKVMSLVLSLVPALITISKRYKMSWVYVQLLRKTASECSCFCIHRILFVTLEVGHIALEVCDRRGKKKSITFSKHCSVCIVLTLDYIHFYGRKTKYFILNKVEGDEYQSV